MFKKASFFVLMVLAPQALVFGQDGSWLSGLAGQITTTAGMLVPALIGLAMVLFIWGLVLFISKSGNEQEIAEGKQKMIWGIIALFVIVAVWGLVVLLQNITGVSGGNSLPAPQTGYSTS